MTDYNLPIQTELQKDNLLIALENIDCFRKGYYKYELFGSAVRYYFPENITSAFFWDYETNYNLYSTKSIPARSGSLFKPKLIFSLKDSISAAEQLYKPLVINFANSFYPGGGFTFGARGQEEDLCCRSTLYASLLSKPATLSFYTPPKYEVANMGSEQILFSPYVCVFRNKQFRLLAKPFYISVCSIATPIKNAKEENITQYFLDYIMKNRLRRLFNNAPKYGFNALILGAWGCGAFGHSPQVISNYFYELLMEENYISKFNRIVFAFKNDFEKLSIFKDRFS